MIRAAILGTTGYTGQLLVRLLAYHPEVASILPVSASRPGETLLDVDPGLSAGVLPKLEETGGRLISTDEALRMKPDVVFAALPHLTSAQVLEPFFGRSVIIDLSADFRIRDTEEFREAYGEEHPRPDLLARAVYGLCERYRKAVETADLIANPGCYPTATLLPLLPLLDEELIAGPLVVNALSGISGAGRKAKTNLLLTERAENCGAYSPGTSHRHWVEIAQEIRNSSAVSTRNGIAVSNEPAGAVPGLLFTPHLVPLRRGMAVTTTCTLRRPLTNEQLSEIYARAYGLSPFVAIRTERIPETADVRGSNRCDIGWRIEGGMLILFSVIDNLVKGASGQAVQNMNIRFGFSETTGLPLHGTV